MSWDVMLEDEAGKPVAVDKFAEGGTYPVGGTEYAALNVTYKYGRSFRTALNPAGLAWLGGKLAGDVIADLERAVASLGTERDPDYWADSPGNAGFALSILLRWAKANPQATFTVI